jgi:integrase/recombinase XerC
VRLDDAVTYFLGQWPIESTSAATVRTYSAQLKWLVAYAVRIDKPLLGDLSPELLRTAMQAKMHKGRRTPDPGFKGGEAAAKSMVMAARCMARWLLAQGVPVADLEAVRPRRPPERIQVRVRPKEFEAIEQAILRRIVSVEGRAPELSMARDLALIHLLGDTGLRTSEVCAMKVSSVDFDQGAVIVDGKGSKQRALSIIDAGNPKGGLTLKLVANWIEVRATLRGTERHTMLWTSMRGRPLSPAMLRDMVLARLCRDAGLEGNRPPHSFRRMSFTEAYQSDPHLIEILAQRMGWSAKSRNMIDVYTRGAKVDLARMTPIPSVTGRWGQPKVPVSNRTPRPIPVKDRAALPTPRRESRARPAAQPTRGAHL